MNVVLFFVISYFLLCLADITVESHIYVTLKFCKCWKSETVCEVKFSQKSNYHIKIFTSVLVFDSNTIMNFHHFLNIHKYNKKLSSCENFWFYITSLEWWECCTRTVVKVRYCFDFVVFSFTKRLTFSWITIIIWVTSVLVITM